MEAPEFGCRASEVQKDLDRERAARMKMIQANAYVRGQCLGWAENAKERIDKIGGMYVPGDNPEVDLLKMIVRNCESMTRILLESME